MSTGITTQFRPILIREPLETNRAGIYRPDDNEKNPSGNRLTQAHLEKQPINVGSIVVNLSLLQLLLLLPYCYHFTAIIQDNLH